MQKTDHKVKAKSRLKLKRAIAVAGLVVVLLFSWYSYRLLSADLLVDWRTSGGWITGSDSNYYVVNSKNGSRTYVTFLLLPLLGYDGEEVDRENREWGEKISKLDPAFTYSTYVSGQLDEDTVIFTVLKGVGFGHDLYRYTISSGQYDFLMHDDKLMNCAAGKGKIFCRLLVDAIYRYYPDSGKKELVGEYREGLNLELRKVLR